MDVKDYFKIDSTEERRHLDFRPLGFRDVVVLGRYRYVKAHDVLENHSHGNMLEICYLERGKQTYFVGRERFDLLGGDVFITFPHETHGTGPAPEEKGVLFWMLIHLPRGNQRFLSLSPAMGQCLVDRLLNIPARHFRAGDILGPTVHRIFEVYDRGDPSLKAIELQNLMLRFLLDLLGAARKPQPRISPEIAEVQKFIAQNIDCMLTVRQLAQLPRLSESRFKVRFKKEVGISPAEYMLREKVERAKVLLEGGTHSVTKVSMALGFSTSHYFAAVFKRYTGTTPSGYRAACRGATPERAG